MNTQKQQMLDDAEGERPADGFAPGAVDGKVAMLTPDEAAQLLGEREADEEAFDEMLDPEDAGFPDLDDDDSEVLDAIRKAE